MCLNLAPNDTGLTACNLGYRPVERGDAALFGGATQDMSDSVPSGPTTILPSYPPPALGCGG